MSHSSFSPNTSETEDAHSVSRNSSGNSKASMMMLSAHDATASSQVPFATHAAAAPPKKTTPYFFSAHHHQHHHHQHFEQSNPFVSAALTCSHPKNYHELALGAINSKLSAAPSTGRIFLHNHWAAPAQQPLAGKSNAYYASLHKIMHEFGVTFVPWPSRQLFDTNIVSPETAWASAAFEHKLMTEGSSRHVAAAVSSSSSPPLSLLHIGGLPADSTYAEVRSIVFLLSGGLCVPLYVKLVSNRADGMAHSALVWVSQAHAELCVRRIDRRVLLDEAGFLYAANDEQLLLLHSYVDTLRQHDDMRYQSRPYATLTVSIACEDASAPPPHHPQHHHHPHHQANTTDEMHHPLCPCCSSVPRTGHQQEQDSMCEVELYRYCTVGAQQLGLDALPASNQITVHSSASAPNRERVAALDIQMRCIWGAVCQAGIGAKSCVRFRARNADAAQWHQFEAELLLLQRELREGRKVLNDRFPRRNNNNSNNNSF